MKSDRYVKITEHRELIAVLDELINSASDVSVGDKPSWQRLETALTQSNNYLTSIKEKLKQLEDKEAQDAAPYLKPTKDVPVERVGGIRIN